MNLPEVNPVVVSALLARIRTTFNPVVGQLGTVITRTKFLVLNRGWGSAWRIRKSVRKLRSLYSKQEGNAE